MKKKKRPRQYTHITQTERDRVQALLEAGHGQWEIARILKRDKGTVSREIARNRRKIRSQEGTRRGAYESTVAEHKAYIRRKYAKYQGKKIQENMELREYIAQRLQRYWSPDEISGKMRFEGQPFYASKTAIYEWLYSVYGQRWCAYLYGKRYRAKRRKSPKTKKTLIPNRIGLELRPRGAANRTRYGHYEGDTMISGKKTGSTSALSVTYERKAKFIDARKITSLKPAFHNKALAMMFSNKKVLSLTQDNGIENTRYEELGVPTYFCDPYSSWQKGGVENANKMIRRFIPKGADIAGYSQEYVRMVVNILNNKPRKSLGYKTPLEVMQKNNLLVEQEIPFHNTHQLENLLVALRG
jgi:transposase, IS30 family